MKRAPILAVIAIAIGSSTAAGAEVFQKLSGAQIRAKLVGRQLTDESQDRKSVV